MDPYPWPAPLQKAAYHGLAGVIVRTLEPHTEADPAALLIQLLVAYGNIIGRCGHAMAGASRHYCNLFAVIIGRTSGGRKGTSWAAIRHLLDLVAEDWVEQNVLSGLSSGEGLVDAVQDPKPENDETGKTVEVAGIADKRLLVQEGEFSSVLMAMKRGLNRLSVYLRQAWDSGTLRTLTRNNPVTATNAHISIIGHITLPELQRHLTTTEMGNGFGNRFLWVCSQRSKLLPEGGRIHELDLSAIVTRLKRTIRFGASASEVSLGGARPLWHKVYPMLAAERPGLCGALMSRAEAQVLRLATIYAFLDRSAAIEEVHLRAGLAVWKYCEDSVWHTFGHDRGDPLAKQVLENLQLRPVGFSRTEISGLFSRHTPKDRIDAALDLLKGRGLVECAVESTAGRPKEIWRLKDDDAEEAKEANEVPV